MNDLIRECSYCLKRHNIKPTPGATHGICRRDFIDLLNQMKINPNEINELVNKGNEGEGFCPEIKN